jgi:predicted aconitase with swiveling domain
MAYSGRTLAGGSADGIALVLEAPLSLWGGFDPRTGRIIDRAHPQHGAIATDRVLVMHSGRGSSSSSSVLAEAVRAGTAPRAIVLEVADPILLVGALVAEELYGTTPALVLASRGFHRAVRSGDRVVIARGGRISLLAREAGGDGEVVEVRGFEPLTF